MSVCAYSVCARVEVAASEKRGETANESLSGVNREGERDRGREGGGAQRLCGEMNTAVQGDRGRCTNSKTTNSSPHARSK